MMKYRKYTIMFKALIIAPLLAFAMLGLQGCFWASGPPQYASTHTVCDTNGKNCLACDGDNNCQHADAQYGSSGHRVCDAQGNNCLNCDSSNSNCQSMARSYWGFIF
jgi:hypothetical protein